MSEEKSYDWMKVFTSASSDLPLFANPEEVAEFFNDQIEGNNQRQDIFDQRQDKVFELGMTNLETAELGPKDLPEPKKDEAAAPVPDNLGGEVFNPENNLALQQPVGAIGTKTEKGLESDEELKIMWKGRNLLDLGSNLVGEFCVMNRWQVGPFPKRRKPSKEDDSKKWD